MEKFKCRNCDAEATFENGELKRTCGCQCGVVADLGEATMKGKSSFGNKIDLDVIKATPENIIKINKLIEDWINKYYNGISDNRASN